MNALHMDRLGLPTAPLNHGQDLGPLAVEQGEFTVKRKARRRVFSRGMNRQDENETTFGMGHLTRTSQTRFEQMVGSHAAVRIPSVGRVEHKPSHVAVPIGGERVSESRCVASDHTCVEGWLTAMCPLQVRAGTLHHFGMNVDADGVTSAERGLDEKAARSCHRVDHGAMSERSCGHVDGEASQPGVKADRLEERALTRSALTVGKGCLTVPLHPAAGQGGCWAIRNECEDMVWRFQVNSAAHIVKQPSEATGEVGQTPSGQFAALFPCPYGNRTPDRVLVKIGLHVVQPLFGGTFGRGRHVAINEETLQSTGDGQRLLSLFLLCT